MGQWVCQGAQQPVNQSGIGPERGAGGGESGELLPLWVWGEELDMELKRAKPHGHHGFSLPPHPTRSTLLLTSTSGFLGSLVWPAHTHSHAIRRF